MQCPLNSNHEIEEDPVHPEVTVMNVIVHLTTEHRKEAEAKIHWLLEQLPVTLPNK